jgi:hypothetical protein
MPSFNAAGHDFRQKGLKDEVVFVADQMHFDGGILSHQPSELLGRTRSRKPTAQDQYANSLVSAQGLHQPAAQLGAAVYQQANRDAEG